MLVALRMDYLMEKEFMKCDKEKNMMENLKKDYFMEWEF